MSRRKRSSQPTTIRLTADAEAIVQTYESEQGRSRSQAINELLEISGCVEASDADKLKAWRKFLEARKARVTAAAKLYERMKHFERGERDARKALKPSSAGAQSLPHPRTIAQAVTQQDIIRSHTKGDSK